MSNHSFMFLDTDFKDISKFCMRMEKNIVEGDGVDAVIWAGKIAERVTNYITQFIELDLKGLKQHEKLERLFEDEVIPEHIFKDFNSIRHYRNIATHRDLRDELKIAKNLHLTIFNILCWFYGTYSADESILNKKYIGISYQHDPSFIDMITNNMNNSFSNEQIADITYDSKDNLDANLNMGVGSSLTTNLNSFSNKYFSQENVKFNDQLNCWSAVVNKNNKTITIGHYKTRETAMKRGLAYVNSDEFRNYTYISIPPKLKGGVYSYSRGINFSEKYSLWTASFNKQSLGYFISENTAIIARKEYIDTLPLPEKKNGSYSDYKEISFDENQKMWYIKKDGEIYDYYDSEKEAIYNLSKVLNLDISIEDLGIHYDEEDSKWRFSYKGRFVGAYDSEKEAIEKRLKHISEFAQPKRNKDGEFSIHRGIFYDEKNLIWVLKIKNEIIGFYESEEEAFNAKKEFLRLKGFDVSNLIFNQEENFDESFDFKVKLYSDENAVEYDKKSDEWVSYFMGRVIGRSPDEESARHLRKQYLKTMPFVPRKPNGKYSNYEGIDFDKDEHLWISYYGEESLGLFDSEEDAFYARKEALIADGEDVSDMHFDRNGHVLNDDSSEGSYKTSGNLIDYKSKADDNSNSASDYPNELDEEDTDSLTDEFDSNSSEENISDIENIDSTTEISSEDIEKLKKSPLFGIGLKRDKNNLSPLDNITYDDLESDMDMEEEYDDIDLSVAKNIDNGFTNMNENIDLKLNRHDLKEITLKSYDKNNYRNEITVSYNKKNVYLTLEGAIRNKQLENILSLDLLGNSEKLEFNKMDGEYFSIFFRLKYPLQSMNLDLLFRLLSEFGWNFDLLSIINRNSESIINISSKILDDAEVSNSKFSIKTSEIDANDDYEVDESNSISTLPNKSSVKDENSLDAVSTKKDNSLDEVSTKEDSELNKTKSNGQKVIRGGKVVTEEEARRIDNAIPKKEIKSNIISKRPENNKQNFNTSSDLGDVIKWSKVIDQLDDDSDLSDDIDSVESESKNELGVDSVDLGSKNDLGVDSVELGPVVENSDDIFSPKEDLSFDLDEAIAKSNENDEEKLDSANGESVDNIDDGLNSEDVDLSEDIVNEEDSTDVESDEGIEKVLEILEKSKQFDVEEVNEEENMENVSQNGIENIESVNSTNDEPNDLASSNEQSKPKKPKKEVKPKKLAVDAFDEKYANSLEIEHDEDNDKWLAFVCGQFIKACDNPKEAVKARKKYLMRMVSRPRKNPEGKYSRHEGIDFDTSERMWTSSINGVVVLHSISEKDAVAYRRLFIDQILPKIGVEVEDFDESSLEKITSGDFKKVFDDEED